MTAKNKGLVTTSIIGLVLSIVSGLFIVPMIEKKMAQQRRK